MAVAHARVGRTIGIAAAAIVVALFAAGMFSPSSPVPDRWVLGSMWRSFDDETRVELCELYEERPAAAVDQLSDLIGERYRESIAPLLTEKCPAALSQASEMAAVV